jgi:hypothetical protein
VLSAVRQDETGTLVFRSESDMPGKRYVVTLATAERDDLVRQVSARMDPALNLTRARILLKADTSPNGPSWTDERIAEALEIDARTVARVRRRFVERGLKPSLARKKRNYSLLPRKLDKTRLMEIVHQSPRTFGKKTGTWTLQLLADACAEIGIAQGTVCCETVRKTLIEMGVTWRRAQLWMTSPDPQYAEKKARRDRLIRLAEQHQSWVLGFLDEVWWSRIARPPVHAWTAGHRYKVRVLSSRDDDPDPVAICCYGMLRQDTNKVMLRFVEGRPAGDMTVQFLAWICEQLQAERKTRLIIVWDDASWHSSGGVAKWIRVHNRRVQSNRGGVQVVDCPLPVMSPWLNHIETRWGPAKRAILDADRILTAREVVARVCEHFGSEVLPYLKKDATSPRPG